MVVVDNAVTSYFAHLIQVHFLQEFVQPKNLKQKAIQLIQNGYEICSVIQPIKSIQSNEIQKFNDQQTLTNRIGQVFSSIQALNLSFYPGNSPHIFPNEQTSLFDIQAANMLLDIIKKSHHLQNVLETALDVMCHKLSNQNLRQLAQLRVLIVLAFYSVQFENQVPIISVLIFKLGSLQSKVRQIVINWFEAFQQEQIGRLIDKFNVQVSKNLKNQKFQFADKPVKLLQLFFKHNQIKHWLPVSRFYNQHISSMRVDKMYLQWMVKKQFNVISYPFLINLEVKAKLLNIQSKITASRAFRQMLQDMDMAHFDRTPYLVCHVSRQRLLEDAMHFVHQTKDFKKPLKVVFKNQKGIDQGGVSKQFFSLASHQLFGVQFGMFQNCSYGRLLWFNPATFDPPVRFELAGNILALAIFNSVNIQINLSPLIYKKLYDQQLTLSDLRIHDQELFNQMKYILQDPTCDFESLCATFTTILDVFGDKQVIQLIEGGKEQLVTSANKQMYVNEYVNWLFNKSIQVQFNAFKKGFFKVLSGEAIKLFHYSQIQQLVQGNPNLDFQQLRKSTRYETYTGQQPIIKWLCIYQKRRFLLFCTGSDRAPIGGLKVLQFIIQRHGPDSDKLPCASTCFNVFLLPQYISKRRLNLKLLKAIDNAQGFGLL